MDFRNNQPSHLRNKSGGPSPSRNASPFGGQRREPAFGGRSGAPDGYSSNFARAQASSFGQRVASPQEQDSQARIEARHDELKRQIALKERQLADMTNERDTAQRLRTKLGLSPSSQMDSGISLGGEDRGRSPLQNFGPQRNNYMPPSSTSPNRIEPGMGGMRSTHLGRPTSSNRPPFDTGLQRDTATYPAQQLQFHPTRQYRQVSAVKTSPLRATGSNEPIPARGQNNVSKERSISPYERDNSGMRNTQGIPPRARMGASSPLRSSYSPGRRGPSDTYGAGNSSLERSTRPLGVTGGMASTAVTGGPRVAFSPGSIGAVDLKRFSGPGARGDLYQDRVEAMTIDNASLQRRLHQVSSELDRINREKEDLARNLQQFTTDNARMDGGINHKDETDMANQAMKDDLERHKQENARMQNRLRAEETETHHAGEKLNSTNVARKNLELDADQLQVDLGLKLRHMDDISKEKGRVLSDIHAATTELEQLNREHLVHNHDNIDMETHVARLMAERHELLKNLEQLTITYDDCVRDITRERKNMDAQNDWQTKLIVAKIVFENIQLCQRIRAQKAFKEMSDYVGFDKDCHQKLRSFSNVMYKLGAYKMKIALHQWYDNALKPLPLRHQNEDVSIVIDCNRLQAKTFYAWKQYQQTKLDRYQFKTNSIEIIWYLLNKGAKQEMKRAFAIWKEKKRFDNHKLRKMHQLLQKKNQANCTIALNSWRTYSKVMGHACRVRILQIEYSQKLYLSQVFQQMRTALKNQRRLRHMYLNTYVKAWKDFIAYNRNLMQKNMAAIQFGKENQRYIMKNCFDALKQESETAKFDAMYRAVKEDMDPAIESTSQWNMNKDRAILTKSQLRAGNITRDMLGKRLLSYFLLWKKETDIYRVTLHKKIKGRLLKMYSNYMLSYFKHWKDKMNYRVTEKSRAEMYSIENQNTMWHKEAMERAADIKFKEEAMKTQKRKMVHKTFRKLFNRKLGVCLDRWKMICGYLDKQEDKSALVIKRLRARLCRDAFERYKIFYKKSIQHERNVNGSIYMKNTLDLKQLRKCFNMMVFETQRQVRARKYWNKIFGKMDHFMKKRAMITWRQGSNNKFAEDLISTQDNLTDLIQQRKEEITQFEQIDFTQESYIEQQRVTRRSKAYRQLGNYFKRTYQHQSSNKFRIWKDRVRFLKHADGVLRKTLNHWKKSQFLMMKHVLSNFMNEDRKREYLESIKQSEIDQMMINTKRQHQVEMQDKLRYNEQMILEGINYESCKKEEEYLKLMQIIERRNKEWVFGSRKRFIFMMWRHVMKQEKAFCIAVANCLTKSLYRKGLDHIQNQSKNWDFTVKTDRTLKKFINRFFVLNATDAFTLMKKNALFQVEKSKNETFNHKIMKINEFDEWRAKTKDTNMARVLQFFVERNNKNIWRALVNSTKHSKLVKAKTAEFHERQCFLRRQFAVKRWHARFMKTRYCIARKAQLVKRFKWQYVRASFFALKSRWQITKRLATSLSNLEKMMREKMYGDSFKVVKAYAVSKGLVFGNNKIDGARDMLRLVKLAYLKRLSAEFQKYKNKTHTDQKKVNKLKNAWGHASTIRLRDAFDWWKRKHDLLELKDECTDSGPVRAQHWIAMRQIDNLKDLMLEEHYTPKEIEDKCKKVFSQNEHLMQKYIKRIRITQDEKKKVLPSYWNRWRQYVGIRKLIRYQFQFMENNTSNVKADLQRAFKKWKNGPEILASELSKLNYNVLADLGLKASKQVAECGDTMAENQSIQNHLLIQRDEFLNYYVKSQILGMALIKDRSRYTQMQSWSRWLWQRKLMNKQDLDNAIRDAAYMQANLEARQADFYKQNEFLTKENAELSQFSDDGVVIRRNMERLKSEVEDLRDQKYDVDKDFDELMAENDRLKEQLALAEGKEKDPKFLGSFKIKVESGDDVGQDRDDRPKNIDVSKVNNRQETEAQRKQRERFEKLEKMSKGASLR